LRQWNRIGARRIHAAPQRARRMLHVMDHGSVDLEFVAGPLLGLAIALAAMLMMASA
jgi:hypothetical protein